MRSLPLFLALALLAVPAAAQQERPRPPHKAAMKQEERHRMGEDMRHRMREDMREVNRGQHVERQRQMTPQQRDRLRRDVQDANRDMRR